MEKMKTIMKCALDKQCCGCSACQSVCPVQAVRLVSNQKGFLVPNVNTETCIGCGQCLEVCQIGKSANGKRPMACYGVTNTVDCIRMGSASGGLFMAVAEELWRQYQEKFHCFGAAWGPQLEVVHTEAKDLDGCRAFMGSKYVQSDLAGVFPRIRELLEQGETVLFTGTGCQCAGLRNYLTRFAVDDENLFLADIVCHGVPSRKLWKDYKNAVEASQGKKLTGYQFRDKTEGWRGLHPTAVFEDGSQARKDNLFLSYGRLFGNLSLNAACYACEYANTSRMGDITLGDYWGIEKSDCGLDDGKGVSLCLVNTEKGLRLFNALRDRINIYQITDDSYLQPRLRTPLSRNILCDDFWKDYLEKGYVSTAKKYTGHSRLWRAAMKLCALIRRKCLGE